MLDDLTEKIQASQTKLEGLASKIPGYAGYKQREQRREADKLLRLHVARQYEQLIDQVNRLQHELTNQGDLSGMMILERAVIKLQLLVDRLRTASYGYSGVFDAIKVDADALDRLYDFDQGMLSGVVALAGTLDEVSSAVSKGESVREPASELVTELERLHHLFGERQEIFLR